jgi:hypothetical protein
LFHATASYFSAVVVGIEEFSVKITDEEVKTLMDDSNKIRYEKVFEWCLPRFGDDDKSLFEFQAARMRNCMRKRFVEDGWNPRYYIRDRVITADHVTRFYGACLAKMFMGNQSINRTQAIRVPEVRATVFFTSKIHALNTLKCLLS